MDYQNSILNNIYNKRGFYIGDAVYIKSTNAIGRIIDGGNTNEWGNECRTDMDGVRSFSDLEHFKRDHLDIDGVHVADSFNPDVKNYDPEKIRRIAPGYVCGEYTPYATDAEVIMITERSDYAARLHNSGKDNSIYKEFIEMTRKHVKQRAEWEIKERMQ